MEKQELDAKVEEIAKALFSYCSARTSNHFEAKIWLKILFWRYINPPVTFGMLMRYMASCGRLQAMFINSGVKTKQEAKNAR